MPRVRTGQAIVEAAVAFMAFMLILLGTIDYGRSYLRCAALQNAVIEGAAYASKHGGSATPLMNDANKSALIAYVKNAAWALDPANPYFAVQPKWYVKDATTGEPTTVEDPTAAVGNFVTITATYPMNFTPLIARYFTSSGCNRNTNCTASSTMRIVAQK